jgi:hypothetical protein
MCHCRRAIHSGPASPHGGRRTAMPPPCFTHPTGKSARPRAPADSSSGLCGSRRYGDLDIGSCYLERRSCASVAGVKSSMALTALAVRTAEPSGNDFPFDAFNKRHIRSRWKEVMQAMQGDPLRRWGVRSVAPLTEASWKNMPNTNIRSMPAATTGCSPAASRPSAWSGVSTTSSSGGAPASMNATRSFSSPIRWAGWSPAPAPNAFPDKILGVIHGVMPALGAPLAYRRLACGTECDNPANDSSTTTRPANSPTSPAGGPRIRRPCCRSRRVRSNCCRTSFIRNLGCMSACAIRRVANGARHPGLLAFAKRIAAESLRFISRYDSWYRLINPAWPILPIYTKRR